MFVVSRLRYHTGQKGIIVVHTPWEQNAGNSAKGRKYPKNSAIYASNVRQLFHYT
jgi:hypothetical protein